MFLDDLESKSFKPVIGFTCGTFDLLHAGHIGMFEWCREQCDRLIVGLQYDPSIDREDKNKPIQSIVERAVQLRACKYVDEVIVYATEADLEDLISTVRMDVRFVGIEYKEKDFTGRDLCDRLGIEVQYNPRDHDFSTSDLRTRIFKAQSN